MTDVPAAATPPSGGRAYPQRPIVGVAGVVLARDTVLLIRRGQAPMLGAWSLPGGALELGETLAEGVRREIFEETGVRVRPVEMVATLDRIVHDPAGQVQFHYVLIDWSCVPESAEAAEPVCGDDALDAAWVAMADLARFSLTADTLDVIERARASVARRQAP